MEAVAVSEELNRTVVKVHVSGQMMGSSRVTTKVIWVPAAWAEVGTGAKLTLSTAYALVDPATEAISVEMNTVAAMSVLRVFMRQL